MKQPMQAMRDVLIEEIYERMFSDRNIFFLTADFGSPKLDKLRTTFKKRFINVGIAEQNLVNVSTGLALEGFTVYAYAIAAFLTMRAYEQIRINISLQAQLKDLNINLIGVGAGLSYDVSGPTHHCLEDISIIRTLPNIVLFSPSDTVLVKSFVNYSLSLKKPKYLRLDGKPLPVIHENLDGKRFDEGFIEMTGGEKLCIVSTGYMTHKASRIAKTLSGDGLSVGIIDIFFLKPLNEELLYDRLSKYDVIVTLEEGFIGKGGLDSLVCSIVNKNGSKVRVRSLGFKDTYCFEMGSREYLHELNGLSEEKIIKIIKDLLR